MNQEIDDSKLISDIKNSSLPDKTLKILIDKHFPMFLNLYKKYSSALNASGINKEDLFKEKDYIVYKSVLSYDEKKGSKFSTWLYNQFRFEFLNQINKKDNLLPMEDASLNYLIDSKSTFQNTIDYKHTNDYIFSLLESLSDKRISRIYQLRYFHHKKLMPWSKIGKELNISTQTAINLHNKGMSFIKNKIISKNYLDKV